MFGVWAPGEDVAKLTYFGLYAIQHRGQESAGIATSNGERISVYKDMGLVSQVFDETTLNTLIGHMAVGHCRYSTTGGSGATAVAATDGAGRTPADEGPAGVDEEPVAQRLAAGLHLQLGDADAVGGLEAVEQGLGDGQADLPGLQRRGLQDIAGQLVADSLEACRKACGNLRAIACQCLRHVLIGRTLSRPLGIELRIGLIRLDQRFRQALGAGSGISQQRACQCAKADARQEYAPRYVANISGTLNHVIPQTKTPAAGLRRRPHIYLFRGQCRHTQTAARHLHIISILVCCRLVTGERNCHMKYKFEPHAAD